MKKLIILITLLVVTVSCQTHTPTATKEVFPYGLSEKEWNELSIRDKTLIRRDYHFYENGNLHFVNPSLEIEGKKEQPSYFKSQPEKKSSATTEAWAE